MSENRLADAMERAEREKMGFTWGPMVAQIFDDRQRLAARVRELEAEVERLRRIADKIPPYLQKRIEDAMDYEDDPGEGGE
jgi:hypothetical protein